MVKTTIDFDYGRDKGNNTGLGKNSNKALQEKMVQAVIQEFHKQGIKGIRYCFHIDGKIYSIFMDIEKATERAKLEADGKSLKLFAPFSRVQAKALTEEKNTYYIGTFEELDAIKQEKGLTDYGKAVEYQLAKKLRKPFDHTKAWSKGTGEFGGYEVKFLNFGNGVASTTPRCRLTNRKQLEGLGYRF